MTTSVSSGNTLWNLPTVKWPSPLWNKAVDKQFVLGWDSSCQT